MGTNYMYVSYNTVIYTLGGLLFIVGIFKFFMENRHKKKTNKLIQKLAILNPMWDLNAIIQRVIEIYDAYRQAVKVKNPNICKNLMSEDFFVKAQQSGIFDKDKAKPFPGV